MTAGGLRQQAPAAARLMRAGAFFDSLSQALIGPESVAVKDTKVTADGSIPLAIKTDG